MNISMQHCSIKMGRKTIFKDIDFSFNHGSCVYISGKNGSGKTVFLNTILGLNKNTTGTFISKYNKNDLCYISDIPFFTDEERIVDILRVLTYFYKVSFSEVKNILDYLCFDTSVKLSEAVRVCSLGTRKKLQILPLFFNHLHFFVLDEITHGLDTQTCELVCSRLTDLRKENKSIIFTEHNPVIANRLIHSLKAKVYLCENKNLNLL